MEKLINISIRCSTIEDLHSIYNLSNTYLKNSWNMNSYMEDFNNEYSKYFSLIYKNNLIGFLSVWVILDEISVTNIVIDKAYRRNGFGKMLLNHLFDKFKGYKFFLEVRESNIKAIELYKSFDFIEIGKRINYYRNPTDNAIVMKKF